MLYSHPSPKVLQFDKMNNCSSGHNQLIIDSLNTASVAATFISSPVVLLPRPSFLGHQHNRPIVNFRVTKCRRRARSSLNASLVSELAFKAVEVAAATMVSQSAFPTNRHTSPSPSSTSKAQSSSRSSSSSSSLNAMMSDMYALLSTFRDINNIEDQSSRKKWMKLAICIVIDLVGSGGLGVPLLSDLLDVVTAPISALVLHALFANYAVSFAGLTEELLPGTDGIPTATLAWFAQQRGYIPASTSNVRDVHEEIDYVE